ncbi:TPA: hypothetical protein SEY12_001039 [Campylobacter jejuni]|nr:hypothetical protein [Campylobacter jejuni]HEG5224238.1 hypothetical protein [Campylobacter jejuni]HEG5338145.1 hypothetical protein [Campylobacter jejuni]
MKLKTGSIIKNGIKQIMKVAGYKNVKYHLSFTFYIIFHSDVFQLQISKSTS